MRDPVRVRVLTMLWLGLVFAPVPVALFLSRLPANSFCAALPASTLQWLVILGVGLGTGSLMLLKRYRAAEARGGEDAIRLALFSGAGAADLPMLFGCAYLLLGGEQPVFLAMCAASVVFIALFRPRSG